MIVVDTGSTDETPDIARRAGASVFTFPWSDDFSAARNESLRRARGRWLFWMDSDDTIDEHNGRRLKELVHRHHPPNRLGFVMQVHCPGQSPEDCTVVDHVKLIRNLPELKFDGRIHEQVLPAIRALGGEVDWTDIYVVHSGSDQTLAGRARKQERDLRILHLELGERPSHPFTLFNLGMTYADMGEYQQAVHYLTSSIAASGPGESHLRKAYALLVSCYGEQDRLDLASSTCNEARKLFPDDAELLFRSGIMAHRRSLLQEAEEAYVALLQPRETSRYFASVDRGIFGFKARHNLAAVYQDMNRPDLAEIQWRYATSELPAYHNGWRGLIECLLRLNRFQTAVVEVEQILEDDRTRLTGLLLRAQIAQAHGDLAAAKQDILLAVQDYPDDTEPLESLCRLLFNYGGPLEAKLALQELSARLPDDGAVWHNLGTANVRLGQFHAAVEAYEASLRVRPESDGTQRELANARSLAGSAEIAVSPATAPV